MKISEAEKLVCPFIRAVDRGGWNRDNGCPSHINCITDKCMAWETTKTKAIQDNFFKCTCGQTFDVYRYDFTCPKCGREHTNIETDLPRSDCEGYCKRLDMK